ncbi:hypothetical protein TBLA_0F03320 [Henningerozyma blattae CBS 6284]|uniref:Pru domain-containing protein n=1 Tax=Henningerozyma blattae (strain ATCC 34711 / CBS 6284 / DSM 70876 / NBRC 10599 / NRRL Y-10934 / UCD 77-7) TaxID=1071380 RepID=I2H668_HENB6|nr:hypothetical protein TBLA_0F03320 [Tetrapisispora blattae CBS 6284]CCH61870.1 hypothetical protein TBLA_0F03320 [Tetrapisispora blattae CBS 6284]
MSSDSIRFRAGIAEYDEETRQCTPLAVQGEIRMKVNSEEEELGFWDFDWVPLEKPVGDNAKISPISLILIPGETMWVPIKSCKSGRMFSLIFSSNEKYFFWLQQKNPKNLSLDELNEKDAEIFTKMTKILNEQEVNDSSDDDDVETHIPEKSADDEDVEMGEVR